MTPSCPTANRETPQSIPAKTTRYGALSTMDNLPAGLYQGFYALVNMFLLKVRRGFCSVHAMLRYQQTTTKTMGYTISSFPLSVNRGLLTTRQAQPRHTLSIAEWRMRRTTRLDRASL
jgi:hypothetical protein